MVEVYTRASGSSVLCSTIYIDRQPVHGSVSAGTRVVIAIFVVVLIDRNRASSNIATGRRKCRIVDDFCRPVIFLFYHWATQIFTAVRYRDHT